ncbi:MAG: hypothetical protein AAGJ83_00015 [Planctomycetota bacterium]
MAGKQAIPTKKFDARDYARQVQTLRNSQKRNFYDWIEKEAKSIETSFKPYKNAKPPKDSREKAAAVKALKTEAEKTKKKVEALVSEAKKKKNYGEHFVVLRKDLEPDDPQYVTIVKIGDVAAEKAEEERKAREERLGKTIREINYVKNNVKKLYGTEGVDAVAAMVMALALLLEYLSKKKKPTS